MKSLFRAGSLLMLVLCVWPGLQAQTSVSDDLIKADKQFDLYAYNLALRSYERVVKQTPNNAHALARIADCYFQLNRPEEALPWYDRAAALTAVEPEVFLRYGQALMHTGDYVGAKKWFMFYSQKNAKTGRHYADMCDYAVGLADREALYITRNEIMNSEASDYGAAFQNNRVVYNSARTDIVRKTQSKTNSDWAGSAFNQLFVTQRSTDNGFLQKPNFLRSDLQNSYNEGPVSYSFDGSRVAFCRNNFIDGTRQIADRGLNMSLYIADVENGNWINVRPFTYNGSDYATGFPCLSPDGRTLYFASNQPNGLGGWDIYVSFWNGSDWTPPHNLGEPLNTPGNEITPYYDGRNFYFSSDWHPGLGGMDIFRADLKELQVSNVYHLGPGINSPRDDYGFIYDSGQNIGYLTSNRAGGRGNEDIWQVRKKTPDTPGAALTTTTKTALADSPLLFNTQTTPRTITPTDPYSALYVLVTDSKGDPLQGAEVDLRGCGGNVGYTDAEGKYYFYSYTRGVDCKVTVRKEGYMETVAPVSEFGRSNIILPLAAEVRKQFTGVVMDARNKLALPDVIVQYALTESGRMFETMTNSYGEYTAMMVPRSSYTISYMKGGYQSEVTTIRPGMPGTGVNLPPVMLEREATTTPAMYSDETAKRPAKPTATFNGYAVQLAATPETVTPEYMQKYETVSRHGNVYARPDGKLTKIRVGVFSTKEEAEKALQNIRRNFTTAFLVDEKNAEETLRVGGATAEKPTIYNTKTEARGVTTTPQVLFAVQIASLSQAKSVNIMDYQAIGDIGNVYAKPENDQLKVRVGIWSNHAEAEAAKAELVKRGYRDPLIVTEKSDDTSISGLILSDATPTTKTAPAGKTPAVQPVQFSTPATKKTAASNVKYYVRVCALSDPSNFDAQKLSGIEGSIEKWPIGSTKMVAIMLTGYPDLESAISANEKLHARGFPDAYIMREENGAMAKYKY